MTERPGAQEVRVTVDPPLPTSCQPAPFANVGGQGNQPATRDQPPAATRYALNLVALSGRVAVGSRVLLNTLAVEMGLGTGGLDFVITQMEPDQARTPPPGHIVKLRYTPLQTPVLSVEAPESPHHQALCDFPGLEELPVVCTELHSQLPAICAAAHWSARVQACPRQPRVVYVMTDGAALPMALSRIIPELKQRGWLQATITAGQSFGGDYEAVNLYSALAAAKAACQADIIVAGPGPGAVGTATPLGFSGVDQGLAVNAAASLGGISIVAPRISFADKRSRHSGLSHHTVTVLQKIARAAAYVAMPRLPEEQRIALEQCLQMPGSEERHEAVYIDAAHGLQALIDSGMDVNTMGRSLNEERPFFLAAAAAGLLASQFAEAKIQGYEHKFDPAAWE
ncbi:MAG TPA: DUF3866 family protein [Chthonomonadaceae bacterium]|nr:DUF3866 family protein [Chthonomonadaceae bacterium]